MNKVVIGLVGEASSGKGELASFLQKKGFSYYSLSDTLRNIATSLGLSHERDSLMGIGNSLREKFGSDILARGAKRWIETETNSRVVIDSIRNPGELTFLRQEVDGYIVGLIMSPERRYELMRGKNRPGDPNNLEDFLALLHHEHGIGQTENGIQVKQCLDLADTVIQNNGTLEELYANATEVLLFKGVALEGQSPNRERL